MNKPDPRTLGTGSAPRRGRWGWWAVGAVLTAAGLLVGSLGVLAVLDATLERTTRTEREHQTYHQPAARIEVHLASGTARLVGSDSERVEVERELRWSGARPRVEESWQGGTLRVDTECPGSFLRWAADDCAIGYAAAVPRDAAAEVYAATAAIELHDLRGELVLHTTTGDITGSDLRSPRARAGVTTGRVDLRFAEPPERIEATTTTGDVTIEVPHGDRYRVEVANDTGTPQVEVVQDPHAERVIEVTTNTGEVHIRYRS